MGVPEAGVQPDICHLNEGADEGWAYPTLIACIGEARPPSRGEFDQLSDRIWREVYPSAPSDSALRQQVSLAAMLAVGHPRGSGCATRWLRPLPGAEDEADCEPRISNAT